jgi:hypothetical protein
MSIDVFSKEYMKNTLNKLTQAATSLSNAPDHSHLSDALNEIRVLSESEVLGVAGGPEVDVETGGG